MSGFQDTSIFPQIVLLIGITNGVFLVSGFASSCWQVGYSNGTSVSYGLWFRCTGSTNETLECQLYANVDGQGSDYLENLSLVRGLESAGYICLCLCCVFNFVYICTNVFKHKACAIFLILLSYTTVATMFAGIILYGTSLVIPSYALGWSFVTSTLAAIICIPLAIIQTMEIFHKYSE